MSYLDWSISQIATEIPGATSVLFEHNINFCSHGRKRLSEVIRQRNLDSSVITQALSELDGSDTATIHWQALSTPDLIERIQHKFHDCHRLQLAELQRLAERVESVDGRNPLCPTGLAKHIAHFRLSLEQHMQKEELILFPMLANQNLEMAKGPIAVMRNDHDDHLQDIEAIYELTNNISIHDDACNTWRALYIGLKEFVHDLSVHIHVENTVLFERERLQ